MNELNPTQIWTGILAVASAVVLLSNAAEKLIRGWKAAKAPNEELKQRMDDFQSWREEVDRKLASDLSHLDEIDKGNRATQQAILALLDHGIDGNNVEQMQHAKEELQRYLINR